MAQAEFKEVLNVDFDKLFQTITEYEHYPQFVEGCQSVDVKRVNDGQARVNYQVSVMSQNVLYVLDHHEDRKSGSIEWSLVESNFFKKNIGKWELKPAGQGKTEVLYAIEVDFKVPVPGFILNRLVKGSLPGMVRSFEKRAKAG